MYFPIYRPRRLRKNETLRRMIRETKVTVDDFIYPIFVAPGRKVRKEIHSMPGIAQLSVDLAVKEAEDAFHASTDVQTSDHFHRREFPHRAVARP